MRILHFCMQAPFTEGYSYQDNLLPEYQHKHGHDVRIVTSTKTRDENGRLTDARPGSTTLKNGVELVRLSVNSRLRNAFGLYPGMLGQMLDYRPDLIFIHGLCSFVPSAAVTYKKRYDPNVRIVADSHQDAWNMNTDGIQNAAPLWLHRHGWKRWIQQVDRVYGTTSWRVTYAHHYYRIPDEKLDTLMMGVNDDNLPLDRTAARTDIRSALTIPLHSFVYITGGKIGREKHTIEALKAFADVKSSDAVFLVFGSVSEEIQSDFYELLRADQRIRFIGYVDSQMISRYLISADFGVFPGRHSVLWEEAIGCGLPCLFHRYEEKDHTEVCDNCVCMADANTETIRSVMEKILNDKVYYRRMKENAEKASARFSYHAIAEKSVEVCKEEQDERPPSDDQRHHPRL